MALDSQSQNLPNQPKTLWKEVHDILMGGRANKGRGWLLRPMAIQVAEAAERHKAVLKAREDQKEKEKTKEHVRERTQKPKNKVSTGNSHAETASATATAEEDNIRKKKRSAPSKPNFSASVGNVKSKVIVSSDDDGGETKRRHQETHETHETQNEVTPKIKS